MISDSFWMSYQIAGPEINPGLLPRTPWTSIRRTLARSQCLKSLFHRVRQSTLTGLYHLSPILLAKLRYRAAWGAWPDLDRPRTFDEKLLWLMLNWQHPLKTRCGDKFTMRSCVRGQGMDDLLPALFGAYSSSDDIDLAALPDRFVLKCSHGCKCNVFCEDKSAFDLAEARRNLDAWMKMDFSRMLGETHYAGMVPRIMSEEFLQDSGPGLPTDYKIFCVDGRAHCTMVCTERTPNGVPKLTFMDREWRRPLPYVIPRLQSHDQAPEPSAYAAMVAAAERLSAPFPFVRMDFYSIGARAVLGEMTFTPGACVSANYLNRRAQMELGELVRLPAEFIPAPTAAVEPPLALFDSPQTDCAATQAPCSFCSSCALRAAA